MPRSIQSTVQSIPVLIVAFAIAVILTFFAPRLASASELDSEAFMMMLMTQLAYQDPSEPMDSVDMVAQLSDLTMMEQNAEMVYAIDALRNQMYTSQGLYASSLVGKEVMVIANLFVVEDGYMPEGEVLLNYPADSLNLEIYLDEADPEVEDPLAVLELGAQEEDGQILFDLEDLDEPLPEETYMMYAYAMVDGQEFEMMVVQRTVVLSVVIPGAGQDVLVDVLGIGLVPLYAITEYEGEYVPEEDNDGDVTVDPLPKQEAEMALAAVTAQMPKRLRGDQLWSANPFFKNTNVQKVKQDKPKTQRAARFRSLP